MDNIAGKKSSLTWAVHLSLIALVLLWLFPTAGLLISSFRTSDQIATSGWWKSLVSSEQNYTLRTAPSSEQVEADGKFFVEGNLFDGGKASSISVWELKKGGSVTVAENGDYRLENTEALTGKRGSRIFVTATRPPEFTTDNYKQVLFDDKSSNGMAKAFFNTMTCPGLDGLSGPSFADSCCGCIVSSALAAGAYPVVKIP